MQAQATMERLQWLQHCGEQAQALQEAAEVLQAGLHHGRTQVLPIHLPALPPPTRARARMRALSLPACAGIEMIKH